MATAERIVFASAIFMLFYVQILQAQTGWAILQNNTNNHNNHYGWISAESVIGVLPDPGYPTGQHFLATMVTDVGGVDYVGAEGIE